MLRVIQHEKTFAEFFLDYLLARISRYQEVIMDQLLNSSEKRLARALLLLADFGNGGKPEAVVPKIHQEELAEMVGTTRSRISFFMNRFRKLGFVVYKRQSSSITIRTAKLSRFVVTWVITRSNIQPKNAKTRQLFLLSFGAWSYPAFSD